MDPAYRSHLAARGLRPATIRAYTQWVDRLSPHPDTLTCEDIEAWIAAHPQWKPNTNAKAVQAIRFYYAWLRSTGRRDDDPTVDLRPARVPRPSANPCPEDTYRAALDRASGQAYWRLRLAADTGLRRAEIAAVHSDDVRDLITGPTLHVVGKGGVVRWIPLPADLATWLRMQRGWAWPGRHGHATPNCVGDWYRVHLGEHVHMLRHRYATRAYAVSHDIEAVRILLGHASTATTQLYISVTANDLLSAARGGWDHAA